MVYCNILVKFGKECCFMWMRGGWGNVGLHWFYWVIIFITIGISICYGIYWTIKRIGENMRAKKDPVFAKELAESRAEKTPERAMERRLEAFQQELDDIERRVRDDYDKRENDDDYTGGTGMGMF